MYRFVLVLGGNMRRLFLLLLAVAAAHAQTATATLSGTFTRLVVPGVNVTVANTATGLRQAHNEPRMIQFGAKLYS